MLHVDVRSVTISKQSESEDYTDVIVEVSNDGAPWHRLATFPIYNMTVDANNTKVRAEAEHWARAWMSGARYAGAEVRATSHGYNL